MPEPRVPPGRAGRTRLRRRREAALRGADLLDRKLRILLRRHRELRRVEDETRVVWHDRAARAQAWTRRGVLLGGPDGPGGATGPDAADYPHRAELRITWDSTTGVRHPGAVHCETAGRDPSAPAPDNTALLLAEAAWADAVRAAAAHAAARRAAHVVGEEVLRTRQRVRALRRHWIPALETALARLEAALEQAEHEDAVRRRWAAGRGNG
ncbi:MULTISPECIES: V-type ATP synthase subunit D [unclassified Streptomyces]|uniref:V-type ATP synthase subunit D n=1 Tax=unclassified Streptomyces TaxID=2593676 RepID=UPI003D735FC2